MRQRKLLFVAVLLLACGGRAAGQTELKMQERSPRLDAASEKRALQVFLKSV